MPELASPQGWNTTDLVSITTEEGERVGVGRSPVVLSSTKHHGLVPSDDFFRGRTIYSSNLTNYKIVQRNWFAYATNHLAEGSIGLQERFPVSCVSPIYTVFSCQNSVHPRFLFRLLKSPDILAAYKRHEQASVDRRGAVRYRDFGRIPVLVPPFQEQHRIAEILDTIDDAIRATERLIAKLERVKQGLRHDLMRAFHYGPETLADVIGATFPGAWGNEPTGRSTTVNVLRSTEIRDDGSLYLESAAPRCLNTRERSRCALRTGDILLEASGGAPNRPVGRSALFTDPENGLTYAPSNFLRVVRPLAHVNSGFLAWYMLWLYQLPSIRQCEQRTTGIANLKIQEYVKQAIKLPAPHEQGHVCSILDGSQAAIRESQNEATRLQDVKQGLMDDLLTGRVRVPLEAVV